MIWIAPVLVWAGSLTGVADGVIPAADRPGAGVHGEQDVQMVYCARYERAGFAHTAEGNPFVPYVVPDGPIPEEDPCSVAFPST